MQNLNLHIYKDDAAWMAAFEERKRKAIEHVRFCMLLYRIQSQAGRYFLQGVRSWDLGMVKEIENMAGVHKTTADQCMYDLTTTVVGETRPARKPTRFLTNGWCISNQLSTRCHKDQTL